MDATFRVVLSADIAVLQDKCTEEIMLCEAGTSTPMIQHRL